MSGPMKRLRDVRNDVGPEGRLGQVVRAMHAPPPLSREARARILGELRCCDGAPSPWPRRALTLAAAAAALLLFAAAAEALVARVATGRQLIRVERSTVRTYASRALPKPAVAAHAARELQPAVRVVLPVAPETPDPISPVGEESRLLARAIQKLRQERDARGALVILDRYRTRFPAGVLGAEAALVRLDALTTLGDARAALATLDALEISGARATELWVTRGELRSRAGRCREAVADFERALARHPGTDWEQRARRGRDACLRQPGQVDRE